MHFISQITNLLLHTKLIILISISCSEGFQYQTFSLQLEIYKLFTQSFLGLKGKYQYSILVNYILLSLFGMNHISERISLFVQSCFTMIHMLSFTNFTNGGMVRFQSLSFTFFGNPSSIQVCIFSGK